MTRPYTRWTRLTTESLGTQENGNTTYKTDGAGHLTKTFSRGWGHPTATGNHRTIKPRPPRRMIDKLDA